MPKDWIVGYSVVWLYYLSMILSISFSLSNVFVEIFPPYYFVYI